MEMSSIWFHKEDNSVCFSSSALPRLKNISSATLFHFCLQPLPKLCAHQIAHTALRGVAEAWLRSVSSDPYPQPRSHLVYFLILHWGFVHLQEKQGKTQQREELQLLPGTAGCEALLSCLCSGFLGQKSI